MVAIAEPRARDPKPTFLSSLTLTGRTFFCSISRHFVPGYFQMSLRDRPWPQRTSKYPKTQSLKQAGIAGNDASFYHAPVSRNAQTRQHRRFKPRSGKRRGNRVFPVVPLPFFHTDLGV